MAKLIWPVLVLAGAALLATAPLTVSGTFDIFSVVRKGVVMLLFSSTYAIAAPLT